MGKSVWCLAGVEVSSAKSKVCDCKKKSINKEVIIKENNVIINQLNYKAPEKARVTEELVSYMDLVKFTLHVTLLMRKASVCFLFV
jgi:hypothetical protein